MVDKYSYWMSVTDVVVDEFVAVADDDVVVAVDAATVAE